MIPTQHLSPFQQVKLLSILKARFDTHIHRHPHKKWEQVAAQLTRNPRAVNTVYLMEQTSGEPDVITDPTSENIFFYDCSAESPSGRRSLCYDLDAWKERKENRPSGNAMSMANDIGVQIVTVEQYRLLQTYGEFDTKTSSWLLAPQEIRALGGAIFGDYRYKMVFIYHNGASSYYAARGFRGVVEI